MGTSIQTTRLVRPVQTAGSGTGLSQRRAGLTVGTIGWMAAMLAFVISIATAFAVAGSTTTSQVAALEVLSFGIAIAALGTGKAGIVLVLRGILRRIGLLGGGAGLSTVQSWSEWLEGLRRLGASTYLLAIALGLATIVRALHFQSVRLRELPREPNATTQSVA